MQLGSLFASAQADTFRQVNEMLEVPLSSSQPYNPASYDVCLVISLQRKEIPLTMLPVLERIISTCGRKYVYMYNNPEETVRFVLIRGGSTRLRTKAEQLGAKLQLDERQAQLAAQEGNAKFNIAPIRISHNPDITVFKPFEYLYARFVSDESVASLYRTQQSGPGGEGALFQKADRIRLLDRILNDDALDGGADANISQLLDGGDVLAYFPLHSDVAEARGEGSFAHTLSSWSKMPWDKPLDEVNEYFGSRVAFYLAFLAHLCAWLVVPAVVGAAFQAAAVALNNYSRPEIPVYAFGVSVWAVLMQEHWRRREKLYALRWNSLDSADGSLSSSSSSVSSSSHSEVRARFHGIKLEHSHIDGRPTSYHVPRAYFRSLVAAGVVVAAVCVATMGVVAGVYVMRWWLSSTPVGRFNQFVSSGLNALSIVVLGVAFRRLALVLTEVENHRTDSEYYASLTLKTVLFDCVNNFSAFYYLAFAARYVSQNTDKVSKGMCGYDDCMVAVAINLSTLLGVKLVFGLFTRRALPYLAYAWSHGLCSTKHAYFCLRGAACHCFSQLCLCRRYYSDEDEVAARYEMEKEQDEAAQEEKAADGEKGYYDKRLEMLGYTRAEWEYLLPEYDTHNMTFHLADAMVSLGLVTLFVAALPGGPFLGLLFFALNVNADGWMLLRRFRRPWPSKSSGLGSHWSSCLSLFVTLVVITNAGLCVFTMQTLENLDMAVKLAIFVGFQYVVFSFQYLLRVLVFPDVPSEVAIQLARQDFLVRKLVERQPDRVRRDKATGEALVPVDVL